eukprot:6416829-Pyramimonas_sp.AAC.1
MCVNSAIIFFCCCLRVTQRCDDTYSRPGASGLHHVSIFAHTHSLSMLAPITLFIVVIVAM